MLAILTTTMIYLTHFIDLSLGNHFWWVIGYLLLLFNSDVNRLAKGGLLSGADLILAATQLSLG